MEVHNNSSEPWKVTLLDTGLNSMTEEELNVQKNILIIRPSVLTYGDEYAMLTLSEVS